MESESQHIITLNGLSIGYPSKEPLVIQGDASLHPGEIVALAGRNGAGKSTLLKCINGLQRPLEGDIRIYQKVLPDLTVKEKAKILAFVSAGKTYTENITVKELVSMGRYPYTNWWGSMAQTDTGVIRDALRFAGMRALSDTGISELSDGEFQRAMIARALAQDTPLLILDEPTAFLDIPNRYEILNVLTAMKEQGKSILFSTHDIETASRFADRFWVIHNRQLIEGGTEDLGLQGVFKNLFADQNLMFDPQSMKYAPAVTPKKKIGLSGPGNDSLTWTKKALERIGCEVHMDVEKENLNCTVVRESGAYYWILGENESTHRFPNIHQMVKYLTRM